MGFKKRTKTTSKPEIPERAKTEAAIVMHHQIVEYVEKYSIPPSMVINIDQTPLKYAPVSNQTMEKQGAKHVPIQGSGYKNAITATFGITYDNQFLPMQLIYGGKTSQSFPKFKFPDSFSLSANEKHYSNTTESLKLLDEIIIPYVNSERERHKLDRNHHALLLLDVFRGQMTEPVLQKLKENNILMIRVPENMTHLFQPLDLTVNGAAKSFLKKKYTEWYSTEIFKSLNNGVKLEDIEIKLQLSVLKPLQAKWIVELYDYLTAQKGHEIIANGWKSAGITNAIDKGLKNLPSLDPFATIDPLENNDVSINEREHNVSPDEVSTFVTYHQDDDEDEEEWESDEPIRNIFSIFEEEEDY